MLLNPLNRGKSPSECAYGFFPAERIFATAFRNYHDQHCVGEGRQKRIKSMVKDAMKHPEVAVRGEDWARKQVEGGLDEEVEERYFARKRDEFFFVDDFPELALRFKLTRKEVFSV